MGGAFFAHPTSFCHAHMQPTMTFVVVFSPEYGHFPCKTGFTPGFQPFIAQMNSMPLIFRFLFHDKNWSEQILVAQRRVNRAFCQQMRNQPGTVVRQGDKQWA
jgi:hypothetical protein